MGYKVLKQGWRLIAILAIGFSSGCSGNEKIKGIDLDEVGYGSSVFSVLKGEDYESEALKLPEGVGDERQLFLVHHFLQIRHKLG